MDTPAKEKNSVPVDLLRRQNIVNRIMSILEVISERKTPCTFALNGAWGTGKTFVLNMLVNQLWEYHSDKYVVFHYNCWQYDYYEEPLIAIVAAMLDSVDEENHLLPDDLRDKAKAGMELAKPVLQKIATQFVKNKIGVDLTDVVSSVKNYQDALDSEKQKKAESRSFDEFYSFKKAIGQAQEEIRKLAKNRTLVVVVDELDRCLPKYAIKVLERLHHLFEGIENTAVLLAIDKNQLDATIKQLFGPNTNTSHYLRKFITLEVQLFTHSVNEHNLRGKYPEFFDSFICQPGLKEFQTETFIAFLLSGIPIRLQSQIISRIDMVNRFLFADKKHDTSFLCCELCWVVFTEIYDCKNQFPLYFDNNSNPELGGFKINDKVMAHTVPVFKDFFEKFWSRIFIDKTTGLWDNLTNKDILIGKGTMQKLLIYYLSGLYSCADYGDAPSYNLFVDRKDPLCSIQFEKNLNDLANVIALLDIIK